MDFSLNLLFKPSGIRILFLLWLLSTGRLFCQQAVLVEYSDSLRSLYLAKPVELILENQTGLNLQLYWIDFQGEYRPWQLIPDGITDTIKVDAGYHFATVYPMRSSEKTLIGSHFFNGNAGENTLTLQLQRTEGTKIPFHKQYLKRLTFRPHVLPYPPPGKRSRNRDPLKVWTPYDIECRLQTVDVPAVSIALIRNHEVAWTAAYGTADMNTAKLRKMKNWSMGDHGSALFPMGKPVTTKTQFAAASISKVLAALLCYQFQESGLLDFDTDVNHYLQAWKLPKPDSATYRGVTLRDILTHHSGLAKSGDQGYHPDSSWPSLLQVLKGASPAVSAPLSQEFEPGTRFRYSNEAFSIIELLVEETGKDRYASILQQNLLAPLGMKDSHIGLPPSGKKLAAGHFDGQAISHQHYVLPYAAASGLWTTAGDLAKLVCALQKVLRMKASPEIVHEAPRSAGQPSYLPVDPANLRDMITPVATTHWPYPGDAIGTGIFLKDLDGERYFQHAGGLAGFRSYFMAHTTSGDGVVILTNDFENGKYLIFEIVRSLAKEYRWPSWKLIEKYY